MAVHYVGGEPTRIICYRNRKNIDHFIHKPKEKIHLPSGELIFYTILVTAVVAFLVWFVAMCLQ